MRRQMMNSLLVLFALSSAALGQVEIKFAPVEGSVLRRNFEVKHFLAVKRSATKTGDLEEVGQRTFDIRNVETMQTSDRIFSVQDGRPLRMRRYFDRGLLDGFAELSESGRAMNMRAYGESRLKGKSVMFTWVPEDDVYGRFFDAADGVEEDLAFMREDLDLRAFLPSAPVVVGDAWDVDPVAMGDALSPGGLLSYDFTKSKSMGLARTLRLGTGSHLFELFRGDVSGEVKASFASIEEGEEGERFAVLSISWDIASQNDLTYLAKRNRTGTDIEYQRALTAMDVGLELKGEGSIRWDLNSNHLKSYEFSSAEDVSSSVKMQIGGKGPLREEILDMGGRVVVSGQVERR
jgi:hypothetical protein